jgi:hypothetical protein
LRKLLGSLLNHRNCAGASSEQLGGDLYFNAGDGCLVAERGEGGSVELFWGYGRALEMGRESEGERLVGFCFLLLQR